MDLDNWQPAEEVGWSHYETPGTTKGMSLKGGKRAK